MILNIEKGSESSGGGTLLENKIKVSFRLIGDTEHKPAFNGYINWIKTKDYFMDTDSTMEDLFKEALSANSMQHDSTADNYVSWICAPSILGSYKLEEFTNGPNSGWMYTVNGVHPSLGLCEYVLQNNDEVIWHYVNDYTLETSFEGSIAPYLNSWLKALDIEPHEGMIGESKENANKSSIDSSDDEGLSNTANSCVITLKAEEENGKAIATINENAITNAIKDVKRNERDGITICPETSHNITSVTALIKRTSVKSIYDETDIGIMLETNLGNFAIPHDTLKTILDSLENQTIYLTIEKLSLSPYAPEILNRISNSEGYKVSISDRTDNITDLGKMNYQKMYLSGK